MSINNVSLSGNLTRDAELRSTTSGTAVANFCLAVNERVKDCRTGEWNDKANFIDCILWGKRAEALAPMLTKGCKVALSGRLRYSKWERDGATRSKVEVVVDEVDLMSARSEQIADVPPVYDPDLPF